MKYFIKTQTQKGYTAGSKLLDDIYEYLESKNCTPVQYEIREECKGFFGRRISRFCNAWRIMSKLKDGDELILLHPYVHSEYLCIVSYLLRKRVSFDVIIIDIQKLRNVKHKESYLMMKRANHVIAHTERMRDYLVSKGVNADRVSILHFFDYKVLKNREKSSYGNKVVYVGNIDKSGFVQNVNNKTMPDVDFYLYGNYSGQIVFDKFVKYEGVFSPDDLSSVKGDWGLVWDGENTERCGFSDTEISMGSYLQYNCSHKLSMYLSAGIPLIVWKGSSLANFVEKNHLGVTIDSLSDISKAIDITQDKRMQIEKGVEKFGHIVRSGGMLGKALFGEDTY